MDNLMNMIKFSFIAVFSMYLTTTYGILCFHTHGGCHIHGIPFLILVMIPTINESQPSWTIIHDFYWHFLPILIGNLQVAGYLL